MSLLTLEEIERGLVAIGVPQTKARDQALLEFGIQTTATPKAVQRVVAQREREMQFPIYLTIPWSALVSDNRKYGVLNGKMMLTADYRAAKGLIRDKARDHLGNPAPTPAAYPLSLEARVWVPDDIRAHDVANFGKATHDALEGVIYTKDRWLYRVEWIRVGCDVDRPRAELTIRALGLPTS